jgi:hypothetical protein
VLSLRSCGYAPASSRPGCSGGGVADRRTVPMAGRRGRSRCAGDPTNDTVPPTRRQGKTTTSRVTNRGGTTTCSGLAHFVLIHAGGAAVHAPPLVIHAFRASIPPSPGGSCTGFPQGHIRTNVRFARQPWHNSHSGTAMAGSEAIRGTTRTQGPLWPEARRIAAQRAWGDRCVADRPRFGAPGHRDRPYLSLGDSPARNGSSEGNRSERSRSERSR